MTRQGIDFLEFWFLLFFRGKIFICDKHPFLLLNFFLIYIYIYIYIYIERERERERE